MLCKRLKSLAGFSLMEVMIATGVSSIVALGSGAVVMQAVKNEQHAQAVADAHRAADILKNRVFSRRGNTDNCTDVLAFNGGNFNGGAFADVDAGLELSVNGIPVFGGNAEADAETPFGVITSLRIVGDDAVAEYTDSNGFDVYNGVLQLTVQKNERFAPTSVYLGAMGVRIDSANGGALMGCASTTSSAGPDINSGVICPADDSGYLGNAGGANIGGNTECGQDPLSGSSHERNADGIPECPPGQTLVILEPDEDDSSDADPFCEPIVPEVQCPVLCPSSSASSACRRAGMTGISRGGASHCNPIPQGDITVDQEGTPTIPPPPPTNPPGNTPTPNIPSPTPFPTYLPTPSPTPTPTQAPPNNECGIADAAAMCQEICLFEGWGGLYGVGMGPMDCFNVCPTITACPTPTQAPTVSRAPSPTPFTPPPSPFPINTQCQCAGQIINSGEYCVTCIQLYEPELAAYGRAMGYFEEIFVQLCVDGDLRTRDPFGAQYPPPATLPARCLDYGGGAGDFRYEIR